MKQMVLPHPKMCEMLFQHNSTKQIKEKTTRKPERGGGFAAPLRVGYLLYLFIISIILHNAIRMGRNPMFRADSLHAYVFTR